MSGNTKKFLMSMFGVVVLLAGVNGCIYLVEKGQNIKTETGIVVETETMVTWEELHETDEGTAAEAGKVKQVETEPMLDKPVIYVYGAVDNQYVEVALDTEQELTFIYPGWDEEKVWKVVANIDGALEDLKGQQYNYLFWEADGSNIDWDMSRGFCVSGEEATEFLEKALAEIGLNRKEANEMIVYWAPIMEKNEYNLVTFQTTNYTDTVDIITHPIVDNMLRVFITIKGLDEPIEIEEQDLTELKGDFKREGLHIVEWGGTVIN